jgi:hypothetical protein
MISIPDINIDLVRSLPRVALLDREDLPLEAGVYFVCVEHPLFQILYIGYSTNLRARWQSHNKNEQFKLIQSIQPVWINYLRVNWQQEDLEILEYAAIRKLSPVLNLKGIDNDIFVVSRIPQTEKQLIISEMNKPLEEYSSDELIPILKRLGINLSEKGKPKYWMIGAIKKCLYGMDEFSCKIEKKLSEKRKNVLPRNPRKKKHSLEDADYAEIKKIDPSNPSSYDEITIRSMKKLASKLDVTGYSVMTKDELASKISSAIKRFDPLKQK